MKFGKETKKYSDTVKTFAFTLHFYSPRAYTFLRSKFKNNLPDVSRIRNWVSKSTEEGTHGISHAGLRQLKSIAENMKSNGKEILCSLAWDEMNIRRHVLWSEAKNQFVGFITYGQKNDEVLPVASQALVFLITGINTKVSIPIAYEFIRSLKGSEKAALVSHIIKEVTKVGAKIINVTFDGFKNNFTACRILGASFKLTNLRPFFPNPLDGSTIYVICDNCHMLKLIRNCLGTEKILEDGDGGKIEWKFFEPLEKCRVDKKFVTHKITKKHIKWSRNAMNVKLVVQLFSNKVANSLGYLEEHKSDGFNGCKATIKIVQILDKLFDIFNTKGFKSDNIFKRPICEESADEIFEFLDTANDYIRSLKLHSVNVLQSKKYTGSYFTEFTDTMNEKNNNFGTILGFRGFIINIMNLKQIYKQYIETRITDNIPTYQLSQDALECLFSRIRSLNGNCENPPATMFTSALRKILIHNDIVSSKHSNCEDNLNILTVSSQTKGPNILPNLSIDVDRHQLEEDNEYLQAMSLNENDFLMDCTQEATIASIASSIEHKIKNSGRFECACESVLRQNDKVTGLMISADLNSPCISTLYVCKIAYLYFELCRNHICFNYTALIEKILVTVDYGYVFTQFFVCDLSHKQGYIKYIVEEFIRLQANYIAKNLTLLEQKILCRKVLQKMVHFRGQ